MKKSIEHKKFEYKKYLLGANILLIFIVIFMFIYILNTSVKNGKRINITRNESGTFVLTNPILDCEVYNDNSNTTLFFKDVEKKVEELKNKYELSNVSFYFRDLNNGVWIGINEKNVFSPASLLKVPLFMAFLYEAESNPSILDKKIKVSVTDFLPGVSPNIVATDLLTVDKEYSLFEISKSMIKKSDNTAISILIRNIKEGSTDSVFKSIGVPLVSVNDDFEIRVKDYAGFFRVLYNASYLNREMSEKALGVLSETDFANGMVAGVPKNITVAHKFGERNIEGTSGNIQLHDCGIVYYPGNPYIFCVMTHGNDFKNQSKVIQELSNFIYKEVDNNTDL